MIFIIMPSSKKKLLLHPVLSAPEWYVNVPVGVNTLQSIIPKMCEKAGTSVRYTNHSLRATSASGLFASGLFASNIPEKVIQETTGHRSLAGLRAYEQTTVDQQRTVTSILGGSSLEECVEKRRMEDCEKLKDSGIEKVEADKTTASNVFSGQLISCVFNLYSK